MVILLTIFQYFIQSVVDVTDKFLMTNRKIQPASYAFFTVTTGAVLLVAWPWVYQDLPVKFIALNLLSGCYFSLMMYVFFKTLSFGEVSRVVPFVFGLVPAFDVLISLVTGRNMLSISEFSALLLLVPGALMLSYHPSRHSHRHILMKILAAFLISSYNALWQYGAQEGSSLNNLMWNRIGAAGTLILPLALPAFRRSVFTASHVRQKAHTTILFMIKQALGGLNFIFLSHLYTVGKISVISALQGFRYLFLFLMGWSLSRHHKKILDEDLSKKEIGRKVFAISLICLGTLILFIF